MTQRTTEPRVLSERTRRTYAAAWSLFTDWCAVAGNHDLPADSATVIAFLADCPAARKTHHGWVDAIDHQHVAAGHSPPGRSVAVLAALGRPTGEPRQISIPTAAAVEAALRGLPSHGWTQGMFGRRDRCLLVLSQLVGVPYKHLGTLTAGDIMVVDGGTTTITSSTGGWTVAPHDDPVMCGSCAAARWLRVLDLAATKINTGIVAAAVDKAEAVTGASPHLCRSSKQLDPATLVVQVVPADRPVGRVAVPVATADPALAVPPGAGHPCRGFGGTPAPARPG